MKFLLFIVFFSCSMIDSKRLFGDAEFEEQERIAFERKVKEVKISKKEPVGMREVGPIIIEDVRDFGDAYEEMKEEAAEMGATYVMIISQGREVSSASHSMYGSRVKRSFVITGIAYEKI